jgi:hypothetical protein
MKYNPFSNVLYARDESRSHFLHDRGQGEFAVRKEL